MSQAKVDRNKELKANRKSINAAKKLKSLIAGIIVAIVCIAVVSWIGYSVYIKSTEAATENLAKIPVDLNSVTDYLDTLNTTE